MQPPVLQSMLLVLLTLQPSAAAATAAAAACRQHRRKWWKLENYWGDTKPNSKAGAIDTHKHPLKPKSLPFKVGRAWREIDAFIVSRVAMDSHYTLLQTIMNNTWEVSQVESVWDLNFNCPISTLYVYSRDRQEKPIS